MALLRPDEAIDTVLTADVYGRARPTASWAARWPGVARESTAWSAPSGHDF